MVRTGHPIEAIPQARVLDLDSLIPTAKGGWYRLGRRAAIHNWMEMTDLRTDSAHGYQYDPWNPASLWPKPGTTVFALTVASEIPLLGRRVGDSVCYWDPSDSTTRLRYRGKDLLCLPKRESLGTPLPR